MNTKTLITTALRNTRVIESLNASGFYLAVETRRTYRGMRAVAGRIDDSNATVSTAYRWELSGDTYAVRDLCKAHGFYWDPKLKVWHTPTANTDAAIALASDILRRIA